MSNHNRIKIQNSLTILNYVADNGILPTGKEEQTKEQWKMQMTSHNLKQRSNVLYPFKNHKVESTVSASSLKYLKA